MRTRRQLIEDATDQLKADFRALMNAPAGRRIAAWLLFDVAGVDRSSFANNDRLTAYNEGQRFVGLALMRHLKRIAPGDYHKMLTELDHQNDVIESAPQTDED